MTSYDIHHKELLYVSYVTSLVYMLFDVVCCAETKGVLSTQVRQLSTPVAQLLTTMQMEEKTRLIIIMTGRYTVLSLYMCYIVQSCAHTMFVNILIRN